jgi:Outer membrane receptor proteins, mostly Fe transport
MSCFVSFSFAQQKGTALIYGKVVDEFGSPVEMANVAVPDVSAGVTTNTKGHYELVLPSNVTLDVFFSFVGYAQEKRTIKLTNKEEKKLDVVLKSTATILPDAVISDRKAEASSLTRLDAKQATLLPSIGGGVENLVKSLPGVVSNNELSSQYTVRGGNFDENLVYVNGIEIYRPFLVGSGQQEGLSFVNSNLVSNLEFSAGGFAAEYGDKMSSVLDVTYKRPRETAGSLSLSVLGLEAHVEGVAVKDKFSYLVGARYKNTAPVLAMMDTKGAYSPIFTDLQALFNYSINPKWDVSFLGYYSRNQYALSPSTSETDFGLLNDSFRLTIYFDGKEVDDYSTGMGALTLSYKPHNNLDVKLIASAYSAYETETYDIQGQYYIGKLETSLGSEQAGNVIGNQGVGTYLEHARNSFYAQVFNLDHKGTYTYGQNSLKWGLRYQLQSIDDVLDEWDMVDSTGYNLPNPTDSIGFVPDVLPELVLRNVYKSNNVLSIGNVDGFVQNSWTIANENGDEFVVTAGLRANYWGYNHKFYVSPRAGIAYKPNYKNRDIVFRLSGGVYNQTPFYREIRMRNGQLFQDADVQRSYQLVAGCDYKFRAWDRPFILTSEAYYKYFSHIIPYELDNLRIRYYADQSARGYATGLDFKVNGEFVKGIDSWVSLSLMNAREDVKGDYYLVSADSTRLPSFAPASSVADTVFLGWHNRPSNQLLSFSLFFQDYLPMSPTWRVSMKLTYGTGLPVNRNDSEFYEPFRSFKSYRRVDMSFSKQLINEGSSFKRNNPLNHVKNMWISLEVFNLLDISNTVSYTWVKDISNISYGVPSYLTPRYLNLKLVAEF